MGFISWKIVQICFSPNPNDTSLHPLMRSSLTAGPQALVPTFTSSLNIVAFSSTRSGGCLVAWIVSTVRRRATKLNPSPFPIPEPDYHTAEAETLQALPGECHRNSKIRMYTSLLLNLVTLCGKGIHDVEPGSIDGRWGRSGCSLHLRTRKLCLLMRMGSRFAKPRGMV